MGVVLCVLSFFTQCDEGVSTTNSTWVPRGSTIGDTSIDGSGPTMWGLSVGLSADGSVAAVGGYETNFSTGIRTAYVRVYGYDAAAGQPTPEWNQLGSDIVADGFFDQFGLFLSVPLALSANGRTVAMGVPLNAAAGFRAGRVRVYTWDPNNPFLWDQRGQDLDGTGNWDEFGGAVDLSSDGSVLAIGAPCPDGNCGESGYVRVLEYQRMEWVPRGPDLTGEANDDDYFGFAVSLSADGSTVAVGAPYTNNQDVGTETGRVRVYDFQRSFFSSSGQWNQVGGDIYGTVANARCGMAVSLSSNGRTVAAGSKFARTVRVWTLPFASSQWTQVGQDLEGPASSSDGGRGALGVSVALSGNGRTIVVGDHLIADLMGQVHVFDYDRDSSLWEPVGQVLEGEATSGRFGEAVAVSSADGNVVAVGAPNSNRGIGLATVYTRT